MRVVIQRVSQASVTVEGELISNIGRGLLILLGVENGDSGEDIEWLVKKIAALRIFPDENGVMNLDITQVQARAIVVSQFTLHASTRKGNRPSYIKAAGESVSRPLYEKFVDNLSLHLGTQVGTGVFGAHMDVSLVNDGPVTIIIDSKQRE